MSASGCFIAESCILQLTSHARHMGGSSSKDRSILKSVEKGDLTADLLKSLISAGANINEFDKRGKGETAVVKAAKKGERLPTRTEFTLLVLQGVCRWFRCWWTLAALTSSSLRRTIAREQPRTGLRTEATSRWSSAQLARFVIPDFLRASLSAQIPDVARPSCVQHSRPRRLQGCQSGGLSGTLKRAAVR